jgi:hypothetical protein
LEGESEARAIEITDQTPSKDAEQHNRSNIKMEVWEGESEARAIKITDQTPSQTGITVLS